MAVLLSIRIWISVLVGGLAMRWRWVRHPGVGIAVGLAAVSVLGYIILTHLPPEQFGSPLYPPRQGLIGELFMSFGWGIGIMLYPNSREVLYGESSALLLPGLSRLSLLARRVVEPAASFKRGFLTKWTVASAASWLSAFYLAFGLYTLNAALAPNPGSVPKVGSLAFNLSFSFVPALAGLGMGGIQWLFVRNLLPGSGWWWVMGTIIGAYSAELGQLTLDNFIGVWADPVAGVVAGLVAGFLQLQLIKRRVDRPWRWVLFSSLGFCAKTVLTGLSIGLGLHFLLGNAASFYTAQIAGVVPMAMVSGYGLVRLMANAAKPTRRIEDTG
jgi:hypothetical protein